MIVSGFTERSVEEEHLQGSPLDHPHCVTCIKRACRVTANNVTSCELVDCPRGCHGRYHHCKETEHLLLCPEERVACINSIYGCPAFLRRRKLAEHLTSCPASVVFCNVQWNRCALEPALPGGRPPVVMKKMYADCGQLDTALALRDHRFLVDMFSAPQQTLTTLQNPGTRANLAPPHSDMAYAGMPSASAEAHRKWDSHVLPVKKLEMLKAEGSSESNPLYDVSRQTATMLTSTLSYISDQMDSSRPGMGIAPCPVDGGSSVLSAKDEKSPSTLNEQGSRLTRNTSSSEEIKMFFDDKQESVIHDKQALSSVMSLNLGVECFARCQPKPNNVFTFLCAQDIRRDEFPHHFSAVHDRIQSDLGGWMEQRCPLAYLGCPFSFRRFRPNLSGMTICHSWLLESFGLTCLSPQNDCSHQTPSYLIPTSAETAGMHSTLTESGGSLQAAQSNSNDCSLQISQLQPCHSWNEGPVQSQTEMGQRDSVEQGAANLSRSIQHDHVDGSQNKSLECNNSDMGQEASSTSARNDKHTAISPIEIQDQVSANTSVSAQVSVTSESPEKVLLPDSNQQDVQSVDDLSRCLLDSISLEESATQNSPAPTHNKDDISGISTQNVGVHVTENLSLQNTDLSSEHSRCDQVKEVSADLPGCLHLTPPCRQSEVSHTQSVSLSADLHHVRKKQVVYTGASANSCVRVDVKSTLSKTSSEDGSHTVETVPSIQLSDLPVEILRYVSQFLDSFSLYNLSLVSRAMRELCCSLLQDRGVVSLVWENQQLGDMLVWRAVGKRWSFSRCFDPVESWTFSGDNPINSHLMTCPYNQDRVQHSDKFSIIPVSETPLNIQIRDMLQDLLQHRRDFRGWIIWSNFEREYVTEARPVVGPLADVLVALGGTLPQ